MAPAVFAVGVPAILSIVRPGCADTITVAIAVSQLAGFNTSQIVYG